MKKIIGLCCVIVAIIAHSACINFNHKRVKGNGIIITKEKAIGTVSHLEVGGNVDVHILPGDGTALKIETDENLLAYLEIKQEGRHLSIGNKEGYNLAPTDDVKIFLTINELSEIEASGAANIIGQGTIHNADRIAIDASGAGNIQLGVTAPFVTADISGSGSVDLRGTAETFRLNISGAGNAHCYDLNTQTTTVDISGVGHAQIRAVQKINADISGAGSVQYKGNPIINQDISGAGKIEKAE